MLQFCGDTDLTCTFDIRNLAFALAGATVLLYGYKLLAPNCSCSAISESNRVDLTNIPYDRQDVSSMNTQLLQQRSRPKNHVPETDSRIYDANSRVLDAAEMQLRNSGYHCLTTITCEIQQTCLILQGTVISFYLKQVAQESVRYIPGVTRL